MNSNISERDGEHLIRIQTQPCQWLNATFLRYVY